MTETPVNAMTRAVVDRLWHKAMQIAVRNGDDFTRYEFAALVVAAEREACAKVCETLDGWTPEVLAIEVALGERRAYAIMDFAAAIRART